MPEELEKMQRGLRLIAAILFFISFFNLTLAADELPVSQATASSYSGSHTPSKAIDNDLKSSWKGDPKKTDWWLKLDLGKIYGLEKISIWWHKEHASSNYAIQASLDNKNWTNLYTRLSSKKPKGHHNPYQEEYQLSGWYRYLRIYIHRAKETHPVIHEVKLYGSQDITPPTGSVIINSAAKYTNSTAVTLKLSGQDGPQGSGLSQMQFSNDNLAWSKPEPYSTQKIWRLTESQGTKSVYVRFKDLAGNWSNSFSDTIILDTTPPTLTINPVTSPTNQDVAFSYTVTDNFTPSNEITISGDNSPYTNEGSYNLTLTAQDLAGNNVSTSVSFTIDKTPPRIIITSPQPNSIVEDAEVKLEGTVDSVPFSEIRTLTQKGDNLLTKTAQDLAGNSASASVTVYFYPGRVIDSTGGEVSSADNQTKVVIPQGALSASTTIKILPVDLQTLKQATPDNTALLNAVECKPSGTTFNKPVELIYTLPQAEIPGTQVELGLYDSSQNKIIPTGQTSLVPADGYTLSFSVTHFSVYAALRSMLSQGAPIGAGIKIPLPDMFTGAFSNSLPLTLPPGRKGIQPALALSYRSSNPNSWVGLGYSLNPGYIVRSTRLGPPTYNDTQDTFYFVTDAGTTEMVHLVDNLYQAKIESAFSKFFKEPDDSWRVVGKDGSTLKFGQTSDSKETSNQGTFSWYLTKVIDTNGNYIEYSYIKDHGKSYLSRIDYTGNETGISPTNTIEFFLEPRDDISSNYISRARIATAKRLKEIQAKVNSDLVWSYILEYAYSTDTNRSLLKSITQYGSDGKNLPKQSFEYQKAK